MAIVVSDTSPIRALSHLDLLELLPGIFSHVIIPPAVVDELARPRVRFPPVLLAHIPFVQVLSPKDRAAVIELTADLDIGEAEAIVLAAEIRADRILIDEKDGRAEASRRGLRPIGAVGVLVGRIEAVAPLIERLQRELGFHISEAVKHRVLKQAREA